MAKGKKVPDPAKTVEIKIPKTLYDRVVAIQSKDPDFIGETIRAVFDHEELFGISAVKITQSAPSDVKAKAKASDGFFKLCDGS